MARLPRATLAGYPHHLVQRGIGDRTVFEADDDYRRYLEWLQLYTVRYGVDIWAYCLMPSHVHFICVPRVEGALARAFNALHMRYAQYFWAKNNKTRHLWRGRFLSCILDDRSAFEVVRNIENNPLHCGFATKAEDYPWSSAAYHLNGVQSQITVRKCYLDEDISDWGAYLAGEPDEMILSLVRSRLRTGRPVGNPEFIRMLETIAGRRLEALPRGRPRGKNRGNV
jgi:putative transposase